MLAVYSILLLIIVLITWALYTAFSERTLNAAADLKEASMTFNGTFSDNSSLARGKDIHMKCSNREKDFSFAVTSGKAPNGRSVDFSITVDSKNNHINVLIARRTFIFMLDKLSSNCLFSKAAELDLRGMTAYVIGESKDTFIQIIRKDRRLAEAVRYLTFESGMEGFGIKNGIIHTTHSYKARLTTQQNIRALIQELSIIVETLEKQVTENKM